MENIEMESAGIIVGHKNITLEKVGCCPYCDREVKIKVHLSVRVVNTHAELVEKEWEVEKL